MTELPPDLKLIDELLCVLKEDRHLTWSELEADSFAVRQAMARLRKAWSNREMPYITLSLANYFRETK